MDMNEYKVVATADPEKLRAIEKLHRTRASAAEKVRKAWQQFEDTRNTVTLQQRVAWLLSDTHIGLESQGHFYFDKHVNIIGPFNSRKEVIAIYLMMG